MKAVLRVVLDVIEFSSCLPTGDREQRRALLERFAARRATTSSLVVVVVTSSAFGPGRFLSGEFLRLRLRLLGGEDAEILLLPVNSE